MRRAGRSTSSRRLSLALRIGALLAGACYVAGALVVGLDAATVRHPDYAAGVPQALAIKALQGSALTRLTFSDAAGGLDLARRYVARDPIDPVAPAVLGQALLMAGRPDAADDAFRVAGRLGWRVAMTQAYWMQRGLAAGDYVLAAQHADALFRQQPAFLDNRQLLDPMERDPQARAALIERMMLRPDWLDAYLHRLGNVDLDALQVRVDVLGALSARGMSLECASTADMAARLVELHDPVSASALWHEHCPDAAHQLLDDGAFRHVNLTKPSGVFDWQFDAGSDVDLSLQGLGERGQQVVVTTQAAYSQIFARQLLALAPGIYELRWRSEAPAPVSVPMVTAGLDCDPDGKSWLPASYDAARKIWTAAVTVDGRCPGQWLKFAARPGIAPGAGTNPGTVTLAQVELVPGR